jgi:hypothetical protein
MATNLPVVSERVGHAGATRQARRGIQRGHRLWKKLARDRRSTRRIGSRPAQRPLMETCHGVRIHTSNVIVASQRASLGVRSALRSVRSLKVGSADARSLLKWVTGRVEIQNAQVDGTSRGCPNRRSVSCTRPGTAQISLHRLRPQQHGRGIR